MPQASTLTLKEALDERATVIKEAREIDAIASRENRDLTDAERERSDTLIERANELTVLIDSRNKDNERRNRLKSLEDRLNDPGQPRTVPDQPGNDGFRTKEGAFELDIRSGAPASSRNIVRASRKLFVQRTDRHFARTTEEYTRAFGQYLLRGVHAGEELRALEASSDVAGGYLVPMQFVARLIKAVDDLNFIRQMATVYPLSTGDSVGFPSLDSDPDDADWTSEIATGGEDSAMAFGRRELKPHALAKRIKVSNKLLRSAAMDVEDIVLERLGYKFSRTEEVAFLTGDGVDKPLGVFVASDAGISTARDISEGNLATEIQFDGLIEAKYSLKAQYWPNARWMFHRDGVKQVSKLTDANGQYLWQPSRQAGQPDMLLGHPVDMSENCPNTFTTGKYVGLFCDWSYYWIADALNMTIQRLVELYSEANQTGFIGRKETDGMPVLEEAFVRVKLA